MTIPADLDEAIKAADAARAKQMRSLDQVKAALDADRMKAKEIAEEIAAAETALRALRAPQSRFTGTIDADNFPLIDLALTAATRAQAEADLVAMIEDGRARLRDLGIEV